MIATVLCLTLISVVLQSAGAGVLVKPYISPIGRYAYVYPHPLQINNNLHPLLHRHSIQNFGASNLFNHKIVVRSVDKQMKDEDSSDSEDELAPKEKSNMESQTPKENSYADNKPKVTVLHNGETLFESDKCLSGEKSGSVRAKPEHHSYSHHHNSQAPHRPNEPEPHYPNYPNYPIMMVPNFPPNQPLGQQSSANIPPSQAQLPKYGPPTGPSQGPDPQQYTGNYIPSGSSGLPLKPPSPYSRITPIYVYQFGMPDIPPQQTVNPPVQLPQQNLPLPVTTNPSSSFPGPPIQLVELGLPDQPMMALPPPLARNLTWDRKLMNEPSPPYPSLPDGQVLQYGVPHYLPPHTLSPISQYYFQHSLPNGQKPALGYASSYTNVPNYGLPVPPQPLLVPGNQNQAGQDILGNQQNQLLIQTVKPVESTRIGQGQIMNYGYQPLPQNPQVPGQENPQVQPYLVTPIRISPTPNDPGAPLTNQTPCPSLYQKPVVRNNMLSFLSPDKYMAAIDKHLHPYMFN